ncbi:hypothetical protein NL676_010147 [Syzygium grande]|nr:hypothetical protein NL676_010147 [Syzygium grande]
MLNLNPRRRDEVILGGAKPPEVATRRRERAHAVGHRARVHASVHAAARCTRDAMLAAVKRFNQFKVSYNRRKRLGLSNELISHRVQEEERLKQDKMKVLI